jgi:hypothetical protein
MVSRDDPNQQHGSNPEHQYASPYTVRHMRRRYHRSGLDHTLAHPANPNSRGTGQNHFQTATASAMSRIPSAFGDKSSTGQNIYPWTSPWFGWMEAPPAPLTVAMPPAKHELPILCFRSLLDFDSSLLAASRSRVIDADLTRPTPWEPANDGELERGYVRDLVRAMDDMTNARGNAPLLKMWDKLKANTGELEKAAWNILVLAPACSAWPRQVLISSQRMAIVRHYKDEPLAGATRNVPKWTSFASHIKAMCQSLRVSLTPRKPSRRLR